jgi:CRISPR-associated protein Csm2
MVPYYVEKEGKMVLNPDLVNNEARKIAEQFVPKPFKPLISSAQLRRFFGEIKNLERKAVDTNNQITDESFAPVLPLVKMVKSKVAYAANPSNTNPKVPQVFKDWIDSHIDAVNSAEEFEAFLMHFEAVVGFCYGKGMRNN